MFVTTEIENFLRAWMEVRWTWMEVRHIPQDLYGGIMGLLRCWDAIIVTWMEVIHEMDGSETSDGVETEHG